MFVAPLDWQPDRRTGLQPDILVVRRDHVPDRGVVGTAALVVEILSPSTARIGSSTPNIPSVTVHDPVDGSSVATVTAHGPDVFAVSHPLGVRVSPSALF